MRIGLAQVKFNGSPDLLETGKAMPTSIGGRLIDQKVAEVLELFGRHGCADLTRNAGATRSPERRSLTCPAAAVLESRRLLGSFHNGA